MNAIIVGHFLGANEPHLMDHDKLVVTGKDFCSMLGVEILKQSPNFALYSKETLKPMPLLRQIKKRGFKTILELICNSANGMCRGTRTLYAYNHPKSAEFAREIHNTTVKVLNRQQKHDRGIKPLFYTDRAYNALCEYTTPAAICLPIFIDNEEDFENCMNKTKEFASELIKTIETFNY